MSNTRPSHSPREAILLVAGTGSRLRPLTEDRPKCLLEVGGEALLKRLLDQLTAVGIERAILVTGYLHERMVAQVESWELGLDVAFAPNPTFASENNAISTLVGMRALKGDSFLLCDGDILLRQTAWVAELLADERENVLTMIRFESLGQEEMKIRLGDDKAIEGLSKGLDPARAHGESLGVQKVGPSAFEALKDRLEALNAEERVRLYYEDVFAELIPQGHAFYAREVAPGSWTEIDTIEDLEAARALYQSWSVA
ncbi:phosphocholine cytidylyltransferase family protein [Lujinxingia sediminis]|uniref:Phosphocholine cytidylyltransferase family protein n=1 Tax=Lujinxingia sediminis TaxID=2480984 RepID=A0ABY0CVY0_9DELT|nr:phosphocholine cytidylyltransferase family protein [Lujinxingia sediminis]RVU46774.1 phosphocholine cytidylyltransferase family protein [Lujinxingia sediminis]